MWKAEGIKKERKSDYKSKRRGNRINEGIRIKYIKQNK